MCDFILIFLKQNRTNFFLWYRNSRIPKLTHNDKELLNSELLNSQALTNKVMSLDQNEFDLQILEDLEDNNKDLIINSDPSYVYNVIIGNDDSKMG